MDSKDNNYIMSAVIVAIAAPFSLMVIVYPTGQLFLPAGNIILTPVIRTVCTLVMSILDYSLAYLFIKNTMKRKNTVYKSIFYCLTLFWNAIVGIVWYIIVIGE